MREILTSEFKDIAKDTIILRKYKCFYHTCRKTFDDVQGLLFH